MSEKKPVFVPPNREQITREPDAIQGKWTAAFPDALSFKMQGGGKVPADFAWRSSPKRWQEEFTPEAFERRRQFLRDAQKANKQGQFPASSQE